VRELRQIAPTSWLETPHWMPQTSRWPSMTWISACWCERRATGSSGRRMPSSITSSQPAVDPTSRQRRWSADSARLTTCRAGGGVCCRQTLSTIPTCGWMIPCGLAFPPRVEKQWQAEDRIATEMRSGPCSKETSTKSLTPRIGFGHVKFTIVGELAGNSGQAGTGRQRGRLNRRRPDHQDLLIV
jgi:hypothetical protein